MCIEWGEGWPSEGLYPKNIIGTLFTVLQSLREIPGIFFEPQSGRQVPMLSCHVWSEILSIGSSPCTPSLAVGRREGES